MNPERRFRNAVEKLLPEAVYYQAMGGTATNGTPDSYYEGAQHSPRGNIAHILWVEWKWTTARKPRVFPKPDPLQQFWLKRAHRNGVRVAVICGSPTVGYIFPGVSWEDEPTHIMTKKEIAQWLEDSVMI